MFNNPYMYQNLARPGLLSRLFGGGSSAALGGSAIKSGINWGSLLTNTQKSLGIINQAIPLVYQVRPIINNAKTMFKIAGAMKGDSSNSNNRVTNNNNNSETSSNTNIIDTDNKPVFYI